MSIPDERLFRAVPKNKPNMWKDGKITSAVFKDSKGLSVDRQWHRTISEAVDAVLSVRSDGEWGVVSVTKKIFDEVDALCLYKPIKNKNLFHSEIHRYTKTPTLSKYQARYLSRNITVEIG